MNPYEQNFTFNKTGGNAMIKGVNKKVIEINNPQSLYFEKAVMYLKPNLGIVSHKLLRAEANDMIRSISPKRSGYAVLKKAAAFFSVFMTGFLGAFAAYLIIK